MKKSIFIPCVTLFFASTLIVSYSSNPINLDFHKYEKAVKQIFSHKKGIVNLWKPIENSKLHSNSKRVFEIECDDKRYVLRVFTQRDSAKKRIEEIQMAQTVSKAGFGPFFIGCPQNNEFYIVEFAGRAITYSDLSDEILQKIGQVVRKIHDLKFSKDGCSQEERLSKHYKNCLKKKIALPTNFHAAYEDYIKQNAQSSPQIGFCHGSLTPNNIRIDENGRITMINWKNGGNGNIFEDIGYFILTNGLDDDKTATFMEAYLGRKPNKDDINNAKNATNKSCLLSAAIFFESSECKKDKKTPIENRAQELDQMAGLEGTMSVFEYHRKSEAPSAFSKNKNEVKEYALSAWKQYEKTLAPKLSMFARFKKWFKNLF